MTLPTFRQANTPSRDTYSPSKVIDLTVKQLDPLDATQGIVLTFTAPGDDYDNGQGNFYSFWFGNIGTNKNTTSVLNNPPNELDLGRISKTDF